MLSRSLSTLTVLCLCLPTHAGELADLELAERPVPLLGDRLRVRMPRDAEIEARGRSLMGADESAEEETRVVFDLGDMRLVLMANETFTTAGEDFESQVRKLDQEVKEEGRTARSSLIVEEDGFRVYQTDTDPIDTNDEAIAVVSAWVVHSDGTVQSLFAYANGPAAKDLEEVRALFSRVLKTLAPGTKRLDSAARTCQLDVYSQTGGLAIDLPENYVATVQHGPDFLVHRFRKIVPFGETSPAIGVYVGGHPNYQHKQQGVQGKKWEKVGGTLLGRNADWFKYADGDGISLEAIRPLEEIDDYLMLHAFMHAPNVKQLEEIKKITRTMRLVGQHNGSDWRRRTGGSSGRRTSQLLLGVGVVLLLALVIWRATRSKRNVRKGTSDGIESQ
ncbi:MAG: hypothetical protein HQ567_00405 [Candidatus Nealsonbacteria bacterium]|nr:hypothetical protein [Candidatus Nealsonbacteria bacterium]